MLQSSGMCLLLSGREITKIKYLSALIQYHNNSIHNCKLMDIIKDTGEHEEHHKINANFTTSSILHWHPEPHTAGEEVVFVELMLQAVIAWG